jgi:hypothetical protein
VAIAIKETYTECSATPIGTGQKMPKLVAVIEPDTTLNAGCHFFGSVVVALLVETTTVGVFENPAPCISTVWVTTVPGFKASFVESFLANIVGPEETVGFVVVLLSILID